MSEVRSFMTAELKVASLIILIGLGIFGLFSPGWLEFVGYAELFVTTIVAIFMALWAWKHAIPVLRRQKKFVYWCIQLHGRLTIAMIVPLLAAGALVVVGYSELAGWVFLSAIALHLSDELVAAALGRWTLSHLPWLILSVGAAVTCLYFQFF